MSAFPILLRNLAALDVLLAGHLRMHTYFNVCVSYSSAQFSCLRRPPSRTSPHVHLL